jgi:threonine dehydratase
VVEPAGAAATAYLMDQADAVAGGAAPLEGPVVSVLSGGNNDPLLLLRIIRSGLAVAGRYLEFSVRVPDRPGSLAGLIALLAEHSANVLEVLHGRTKARLRVNEVEIGLTVETEGPQHSERLLAALREHGYHPEFH